MATTSATAPATSPVAPSSARQSALPPRMMWKPVLAVALSTFTVVTAEMMPVGLLTPISSALHVAPGTAGTSLTITGVVAAFVATFAPVLSGKLDRRSLLSTFLLLLTAANVLAALSTSFLPFAAARVLIGIAMGIVWANAGGLGPRITDPAHLGRAMTLIFSGVSVGMVLGLPAGTLIASLAGWRSALFAVAGLSLFAALFARLALPSLPVTERPRLSGLFSVWTDRGIRTGFLITALVVIGHFAAYTFIRPVLESGNAGGEFLIVAALTVFGVAGLLGNAILGRLSHTAPRTALALALAAIALGAAAFPFTVHHAWAAFAVLVPWGAAYGGIGVGTQAWIRTANPALVEHSSALWSGVFNAAIAVGSLAGGLAFDALGGTTLMLLGGGVVAAGWLLTLASRPTPA